MATAIISAVLGIVGTNFVLPTLSWALKKLSAYLYGSESKEERRQYQAAINTVAAERKGLKKRARRRTR